MRLFSRRFCSRAALAAVVVSALGWTVAAAQFGPPMTIYGSVTDEAGPVAAGLPIEAYIGDKVCGKGQTQFTGEGSGRVTVYYADVVAREQTAGCGFEGAVVRVKIGNRFADQTAKWKQGPVQLDVTFGDVTPAAIPTFTPVPTRTRPPSTPEAGGQSAPGTETPDSAETPLGTGTPRPTLSGGLISATAAPGDSGGDSRGFPVWAIVILVLGGIAAVGGGVGFVIARGNGPSNDDDAWAPPPDER